MIFVELILSITKTWIYEAYRKANTPVNQERLVNTLGNDKHFTRTPLIREMLIFYNSGIIVTM